MDIKKTDRWNVWSLDYLGNRVDGYEFNDRRKIATFTHEDDGSDDDKTSIHKILTSLESHDDDFYFTQAIEKGVIRAEYEDEWNIYIYDIKTDRPLYQIENDVEIVE